MKHILFVAVFALAACKAPPPPDVERPPEGEVWLPPDQVKASEVQLAPAKAAEVPETMRLAGRVTFNDQRVTHVFSPVTGRVTRIFANVGDTVAKGAPLADVDSPDVGIAMSDLVKAEAFLKTVDIASLFLRMASA